MKHFIIELTYTAPISRIDECVAEHRAFLQTGYDRGLLLMSGPQEPRTGGIIVARAESLEEITRFCEADPFQKLGVARYRFVEFSPVKRIPAMDAWVCGES